MSHLYGYKNIETYKPLLSKQIIRCIATWEYAVNPNKADSYTEMNGVYRTYCHYKMQCSKLNELLH